jgi:flagellar basal-body rod modification protein FlgD
MADMQIQTRQSPAEIAKTEKLVMDYNKGLNEGKKKSGSDLEMNDFLKILTTQLSHQDPSSPVEDKEFLSQMAQISSLKQMSNMAGDVSRLANIISGGEANSALGRSVEILDGENVVQGTVRAVTRGGEPSVLVNGGYYQWSQVSKVFEE